MEWLKILTSIVPLVVHLMKIAEKVFDKKPDSGKEKKGFVMDATKSAVAAVTDISTGGQEETWEALSGPIGWIIEALCPFLFPHED